MSAEERRNRLVRKGQGTARSMSIVGVIVPLIIVAVTLLIAGQALRNNREHAKAAHEAFHTQNELRMASTLGHVEEYLMGVYSNLLYISLEPNIKVMNDEARVYIQALFDHQWANQRLSEIYIIKRDFDGTHAPFMTFEYGTDTIKCGGSR